MSKVIVRKLWSELTTAQKLEAEKIMKHTGTPLTTRDLHTYQLTEDGSIHGWIEFHAKVEKVIREKKSKAAGEEKPSDLLAVLQEVRIDLNSNMIETARKRIEEAIKNATE